jgi:hypothetical protein
MVTRKPSGFLDGVCAHEDYHLNSRSRLATPILDIAPGNDKRLRPTRRLRWHEFWWIPDLVAMKKSRTPAGVEYSARFTAPDLRRGLCRLDREGVDGATMIEFMRSSDPGLAAVLCPYPTRS